MKANHFVFNSTYNVYQRHCKIKCYPGIFSWIHVNRYIYAYHHFHLLINVSADTRDIKNECAFLLSRNCGFVVFSNLGIRAFFCHLPSSEKCQAGRQARSHGSYFCVDLLLHLDNSASSGLEQLYCQQNWHHLWTQLVSSKYYFTHCPSIYPVFVL